MMISANLVLVFLLVSLCYAKSLVETPQSSPTTSNNDEATAPDALMALKADREPPADPLDSELMDLEDNEEKRGRNPYGWMAKRGRNPYGWMSSYSNGPVKRGRNPYGWMSSFSDKRARNPYAWSNFVKRGRNPYGWMSYKQ